MLLPGGTVRILVVKDAVVSTLAILECETDPMTSVEWKIVQHSPDVLQIFAEVITEISSERYVSFSWVLIFIRGIIDAMDNYKRDTTLLKSIRHGFDIIHIVEYMIFGL